MNWTFTDETWLDCEEIGTVYLTYRLTNETRDLAMSRVLRKPRDIIAYKV
jgi:hypothetical protein